MRSMKLKKVFMIIFVLTVSVSIFIGCNNGSKTNTKETPMLDSIPKNTAAPENTVEPGNTAAPDNAVQKAPVSVSDRIAAANENLFVNDAWNYGQVAIGGGGFVTGIISTSEKGLYYAKTDVGGAYRRSATDDGWVSLGFHISESNKGYLGVDGIACDANAPNKLYLFCGTEYFSGGRTALLVSHDYGKTFAEINLPSKIRVHGNGMGRGNGERIAVDPHNGDIIFLGGRKGGLHKSVDGGLTWTKVESFPIEETKNGVGINIIVFDPLTESNGKTRRIYAAVSDKNGDEGNLFVSEDGGESWNKLKDSINDFMPQRIKLDSKSNVYVTYADHEGPWNIQGTGSVYKYAPGGGKPEMIAPQGLSFGDIAIHPDDDDKLVLVTTSIWKQQPNQSWGDVFYISANGGKNWKNIMRDMEMTAGRNPWVEGAAIHWCSSLMIDPFNGNKVSVNSGNGIFTCDNIWDDKPLFYFDSYGLEETVVLDILSMEGYPLISAAGDVDGFKHDDIFVPATRHQDKIGTTTSIAIAAKNRDVWAKVGSGDRGFTYTLDGGKTWSNIKSYPDTGKRIRAGRVALNADGSVIVWSPDSGSAAFYTEDFGGTWHEVDGFISNDIYIIGDPNNSDYFFACTRSSVYISSDRGKSFQGVNDAMPTQKRISVVPGEEGAFYVPSFLGLQKVTGYGAKTETIPNVKYCEAVGVGKGKNAGSHTIYIWGETESNDIRGIYMSENNGQNWERVNDDLHQFGGTGNGAFISGDMNVYGRCYMSTVGLGIIYCDKIKK